MNFRFAKITIFQLRSTCEKVTGKSEGSSNRFLQITKVEIKGTNLPVSSFFVLVDYGYEGPRFLVVAHHDRDKLFLEEDDKSCDSKHTNRLRGNVANLLYFACPIAAESLSTHLDWSWNEL